MFANSNLQYSNSFSTIGYDNITVQWGAKLNGFDGSISLAYSVNGGAYKSVSYTNVADNNTWALIPAVVLPAETAGVADLSFRIVVFSFGGGGTYSVDDFVVTGTQISGGIFYDLSSIEGGNPNELENTANWTSNADGTAGTTPSDFTSSDNQFIIKNNPSASISSDWVLGAGVSLNIGNGVASTSFTVPASASLSGGDVSVLNNATLNIQNTSVPNITSTSDASTVEYGASGTQNVIPRTYGNLTISGTGIKSLQASASTFVNGTLTVSSSSDELQLADTQSVNLVLRGDLLGNGFIRGATSGVLYISGSAGPLGTLRFSGVGTPSLARLIIDRSGLTVNLGSNIIINLLSLSNCVLNIGSRTVYVNNTGTINGGSITSSASGTVRYHSGKSGQTVVPGTYGNLRFFNANKSFITGETYVVLGVFAPGTTTAVTPIDYTMSFQGTSQTIPTFNYDNVIIGATSATSSQSISVDGDFTVNTSFTSTETVTFSGSSLQNISGLGTIRFYDVNANQSISNNASTSLRGVLTLGSSVTFDADGSGSGTFTLLSDVNSDAAIAAIPSGSSISGNITYQRYFMASDVWVNFGIPVNGATVADLQDDFPISGTFTGASTGTGIGTNPSMYYYDESVTGDINQGWVSHPGNSNTEAVSSTVGYSAYMRAEYTGSGATIDVTGTINQGNVDLGVGFTSTPDAGDGYNLVVNPYPSPIDWNSESWTKTNIAAVASVWDGASGIYRYSGGGGWDGIAASGQAIWVQATSSGASLIATENVKTVASRNPSFYRNGEIRTNRVVISAMDSQGNEDRAFLLFDIPKATQEYDAVYDARKLPNRIHNVSIATPSGDELAINAVDEVNCSFSAAIQLTNIKTGVYSFSFEGVNETFADEVIFKDNYLGTSQVISDRTGSVSFSVDESVPSTFGRERFELVFKRATVNPIQQLTSDATEYSDDKIILILENTQKGISYELFDGSLSSLGDARLGNGQLIEYEVDKNTLNPGINYFSVKAYSPYGCGDGYMMEKIFAYNNQTTIEGKITALNEQQHLDKQLKVFPNPVNGTVTIQAVLEKYLQGANFALYNNRGELLRDNDNFIKVDEISYSINLEDLQAGIYILKIQSKEGIIPVQIFKK
ncbi:hypothetical protein GCM10009122_56210 [Fulvivirga kasyanovii]